MCKGPPNGTNFCRQLLWCRCPFSSDLSFVQYRDATCLFAFINFAFPWCNNIQFFLKGLGFTSVYEYFHIAPHSDKLSTFGRTTLLLHLLCGKNLWLQSFWMSTLKYCFKAHFFCAKMLTITDTVAIEHQGERWDLAVQEKISLSSFIDF